MNIRSCKLLAQSLNYFQGSLVLVMEAGQVYRSFTRRSILFNDKKTNLKKNFNFNFLRKTDTNTYRLASLLKHYDNQKRVFQQ